MGKMGNANSIFQDLYEVFCSESECYEVMLDLVRNEREVIVDDDIEKLSRITKKQEEIISELKSLEEDRVALVDELARQSRIKISQDKISLKYLIEVAEEPYSSKYTKLRKNIKELLDEIRKVNKRNLQIIQKSMDTFDTTIELLLSAMNPAQTYSKSGELDKSGSIDNSFLQRLGYIDNSKA